MIENVCKSVIKYLNSKILYYIHNHSSIICIYSISNVFNPPLFSNHIYHIYYYYSLLSLLFYYSLLSLLLLTTHFSLPYYFFSVYYSSIFSTYSLYSFLFLSLFYVHYYINPYPLSPIYSFSLNLFSIKFHYYQILLSRNNFLLLKIYKYSHYHYENILLALVNPFLNPKILFMNHC